MTNNPESYRAYDLLAERLPPAPGEETFGEEAVIVRSQRLRAGEAAFQARLRSLAAEIQATGAVRRIGGVPPAAPTVSPDGRAVVLALAMGPDPEAGIERVIAVVERADEAPFDVEITGEWTADHDFVELSERDLRVGEFYFGIPTAMLILLVVFGAVVAGLVPLMLAVVAIVVALALTALVGQAFDLSIFVVNMLTGMGLALGIDYALFVVSRYREERSAGRDKVEAIAVAGATSSRAVLFSGIAFVVALTGMVLVPDTILRSLAVGAILVGIVAVTAALTLLPAVLSLLGDRVNALRIPGVGRTSGGEGRLWSAVVRRVMRRPGLSLVAATAVLLLLAAPVLGLKSGFAGLRTLPDDYPSKQGFLALEQSFGVATVNSLQIVVDGDVARGSAGRAAAERVRRRVERTGLFRDSRVTYHADERLAVVEAQPLGDSSDDRIVEAVRELRSDVPQAVGAADVRVLVTGETAENVDYFALTERWLPIVFAFVLGFSFLLLTLAFRSVVVAAKAIGLNLLSVGAAYGLLVLVFQEGVGNELFGFQQVDAVEAWVPLFLFSVLFGLSMDYHVFLLSRIRERYVETGDNDGAIAHAVGSTARLITGAALIIIAVFSGFAVGDLVMFQQMGFGVAVSLLIDATLVRSVLVPAAMKLLGERNWWLPRWLHWLPHVSVEGPRGQPVDATEAVAGR
jgi:RND superfamily putative drug exporter